MPTRHGGFGLATVIGNLFGGRLADRIGSEPALRIALVGLMVSPFTIKHVIPIFVNLLVGGVRIRDRSNYSGRLGKDGRYRGVWRRRHSLRL
ncbi:hypothetical protein ACXIUS_18505 [Bosea thiooxidans]|nr:hypothetical protein [Bosea sp. (in: a-proteobacteria)]